MLSMVVLKNTSKAENTLNDFFKYINKNSMNLNKCSKNINCKVTYYKVMDDGAIKRLFYQLYLENIHNFSKNDLFVVNSLFLEIYFTNFYFSYN